MNDEEEIQQRAFEDRMDALLSVGGPESEVSIMSSNEDADVALLEGVQQEELTVLMKEEPPNGHVALF